MLNEGINVKVSELLLTIKSNREKHIQEYNEAMAGYRKAVIEKLEQKLALAREHKDIVHVINLAIPTLHEYEYNVVIKKLEMIREPGVSFENMYVTISSSDFEKYVMDKWDWTQNFKYVNSGYSMHG